MLVINAAKLVLRPMLIVDTKLQVGNDETSWTLTTFNFCTIPILLTFTCFRGVLLRIDECYWKPFLEAVFLKICFYSMENFLLCENQWLISQLLPIYDKPDSIICVFAGAYISKRLFLTSFAFLLNSKTLKKA